MIRREQGDPRERLDALQEVVDLEVRVPIVAALYFRPLCKQRVRLVEQQDRVAGFGRLEQPGKLLLGFADVLRHELREVDLIEIEPSSFAMSPALPAMANGSRTSS